MLHFERKPILRLVGETLREIGILVVVFAPLEAVFAERALGAPVLMALILGSAAAIGAGILLEVAE